MIIGKANLVLAIPDLWIDVQTLLDLDEVADEFKKKKKGLLRVATKYPNLTRQFLYSKGVTQFQLVQSLRKHRSSSIYRHSRNYIRYNQYRRNIKS